jgi:hypothetical protein
MRVLRNVAIIMLLALIVAEVPGGGNAATAIVTSITLLFLTMIAFAAWQLFRQNSFTYASLDDRRRGIAVGAVGAIVLMIAGADELLETGLGLLVWLAVLGAAVYALVRIYMESQAY